MAYYVRNPGGNDGNTGLSDAQAWLTIAKVNASMGIFNAGDSILFNKGDEWQDALEITGDGADANHIIFGAYGTGADPIINGAAVHATWVVADDITADTMILNGKFTADTTSWTAGNSALLASIAGGQDGNCLRITENGANNPEARQAFTKGVSPGDEVEASFYVKQGTEATYNATLYDVTNGYIQIWAKGGAEATGNWVKHTSGAQTVPAGCTEVEVRLRNVSLNGSGTTMLFDEVTVFNPNVFKKDVTNTPGIAIEDRTFLTRLDWDTDTQTTFDGSSSGSWSNNGSICYVRCTDDADPDTHTMEVAASAGNDRYCIRLLGSNWITIDGIEVRYATLDGIKLQGNLAIGGVTSVIIQNCTAYACGNHGFIATENQNTAHDYNNTITIDSNIVSYCGQHGIMFQNGTSDSTISSNTVSYCGWVGTNPATGGHGISQWGTDSTGNPRNNIIEYNEVHHQYEATDRTEGTGIQCDGNTQDSIVRYNLTYANEGSGLCENGLSGNSWYYNISYGNGNGGAARGGMTIFDADTCLVYNNVFYDNDANGICWYNGSQVSLTLENNIVSENATYELREGAGGDTGLTCDYNCVYHSAGGTFMRWEGTDYNWADWLTNSSQDANSINTDPLFTDAANNDFTLRDISPCRDAGIDVGLTQDYDGNAVPKNLIPDIGAYEYIQEEGSWDTNSNKNVNNPVVLLEIEFDSGTRKYSVDFIRPALTTPYKGNILKLSTIYNSIGDLIRTFEYSNIEVIFDDTEYEFRTLITEEGIKNRDVEVKIGFVVDGITTEILRIFKGIIYDWDMLDDLKFKIRFEQKSKNLENPFPAKAVERGDYANADSTALGEGNKRMIIPIPYGTVSALGLSGDGAYGHPSLSLLTGLPMIDTTVDAEKHLVGRQSGAITVSRVYIDKVLKVEGGGNDYTISTQVIDGQTHTEIHWNAGVNPTTENLVSCDITFEAYYVCEAWKHLLKTFKGYAEADFHSDSYDEAHAIEQTRGYTLDGVFWEEKELIAHENDIRDEFELDIWREPKDGLIHFKYVSSTMTPTNHYRDYLDILKGYMPRTQVTKIINYFRYGFYFNYARTYYNDFDYKEDADSQTKYGATYEDFKGFRFVRSSAVAGDLAYRKLLRRKDPIVFDVFPFPLKTFADNLADVLEITHFEGSGENGYEQRKFQIRKTDYDLDNFVNKMTLEDITGFLGGLCILGPDDLPTYLLATPEQRGYCYCADFATEEFSNGDPANRLFD